MTHQQVPDKVPQWSASSRCYIGRHMEAPMRSYDAIGVSDNKHPGGSVPTFSAASWGAFGGSVKER